jgi:hypothetical protein
MVLGAMFLLLPTSVGAAQEPSGKGAPGQEDVAKKASDALTAAKSMPKAPAVLRGLGKSAGANDKRRQVEAISTDTMMRLGDLARAQEKLCGSMQAGADKAAENQPRAEMVAQLSEAMRALLEQTLAPLWSELSVKALRAGRLDFGSVHARFESALRTQQRAVDACRGKPLANGKDAASLAELELREQYEAAFQKGVVHALSQHKKLDSAKTDLDLALRGLPLDRRAALEAPMQAAITEAVSK